MNLLTKIRTLAGVRPAPEPELPAVARSVAIVMDGNGRWAQQRGLPRTEGHAAGEEALFDTVDGALDIGLRWLTVFAFSTENWRRPLDEVRFLMNFNERLLAEHLYAPEMPDPDLLVRTSGELRISNFLLWQLAYAELVFVDRLWPDFGEADLRSALEEYARRRRRFGGR